MTQLYLIRMTEDGEVYLSKVTPAEVQGDLDAGELDATAFLRILDGTATLTEISGYILIRGEIILPKPITVVTKWEL